MVLVATTAVSACTPRPEGPAPAAQRFFAALATGDTAAAAELSDNPSDAREALNAAWAGLQATHLDSQVLGSKYTDDTGSVSYRYTWHLPKNRTWTYDGKLKMARYEGRWQVRWNSTDLHPRLGEHQTLALRADAPKRASVNEVGGTDVLAPGYLYHYTLDASKAGAFLISTARSVVDVLHPFDDTLNDPQRLAEQASGTGKPVDLITLRVDDNNKIAPALSSLPGVVITPQAELLPTDYHFAPALINQVKKAVIDQLDGQAGWRVVSLNQNNVDLAVLHEVAPAPAPSVSISLDRAVQNAAQHAVDNQGRQAMIVVIKPSTGRSWPSHRIPRPTRWARLPPPGSTRRGRRSRWSPRVRRSSVIWQVPTRFWAAPGISTSDNGSFPTTVGSTWARCRCRGRSPVRATRRSPNWPARCHHAG